MNPDIFRYLLNQLLHQSPTFLVAIVGIVFSLIYIRRLRAPALLTITSMCILIVGNIAFTTFNAYVFYARVAYGWSIDSVTRVMSVVGVITSLTHAVAIAFVVAAVFAGRKKVATTAV